VRHSTAQSAAQPDDRGQRASERGTAKAAEASSLPRAIAAWAAQLSLLSLLAASGTEGGVPPGDCCACGIRLERFIGVPPPNDGMDVRAPLSFSSRHGESRPPPVISPSDGGPPDGIVLVPEASDDRESPEAFAPGDCVKTKDRTGHAREHRHRHHQHRTDRGIARWSGIYQRNIHCCDDLTGADNHIRRARALRGLVAGGEGGMRSQSSCPVSRECAPPGKAPPSAFSAACRRRPPTQYPIPTHQRRFPMLAQPAVTSRRCTAGVRRVAASRRCGEAASAQQDRGAPSRAMGPGFQIALLPLQRPRLPSPLGLPSHGCWFSRANP